MRHQALKLSQVVVPAVATWVPLQAVIGTVQAVQLVIIVSIAVVQLLTIVVHVYTLTQQHVADTVWFTPASVADH
jgi:hypothetical protein